MTGERDVIVVGAGHNGLVAALGLARRGRLVTVVEARPQPGGLLAPVKVAPGYTAPGVLHDSGAFRPWIAEELGLSRHGLRFRQPPPVMVAESRGPGLVLHPDPARTAEALQRRSQRDAAALLEASSFLARIGPVVCSLLDRPPPALESSSLGDGWSTLLCALALRRLGRRTLNELLQMVATNAWDWLQDRFETDLLKEALAAPGVVGTFLGPRSAGSAANLLFATAATDRAVVGGPAALVKALVQACDDAGVELRTGQPVTSISVAGGRVRGVTLASGEEIAASIVVASCDPKTVFLRLLPASAVELRLEEQMLAFRSRGTTAKVHLALAGPLELAARPGETFEALRIGGGSLRALEQAFDAAKHGRLCESPPLEVTVPTVGDPGLAPGGHHVVSVLVSFVPRSLRGGWSEEAREELKERVLQTLDRHAPTARDRVVGYQVLTPQDLEEEYLTSGGHPHHGEHALDQLLSLRPAPSLARYRTPIPGLFLAGSGCHPGGGMTGVPGALGARAVLRASRS